MLKIIQCFGKYCSRQLKGKYLIVGRFWKPYIGQAVAGELDLMVPTGRAEKRAANPLLATYCLPYIRLPETPNH
jgi:hypothetical protein